MTGSAEPGDTRVSGRGVQLLERRRLAELPSESMLAPARADKEDFHAANLPAASACLKEPTTAKARIVDEPGFDRHEWESEWQALEEQVSDAPAEALPDLDELVARMLAERGYAAADPVVREGDEPEVVAEFLAARETMRLVEEGSDDVSPGDVAAAVNGYRAVFEYLIAKTGTS